MPKLIGEYFDVKIGDSDTFQIPKVPFHKDEIMPDHGICEKLASQFDSNQNEITISLDDIPNETLFEKLLKFSFQSSNTIKFSRSECRDLEKICNYFELDNFIGFVKSVLQRIDFSFQWVSFVGLRFAGFQDRMIFINEKSLKRYL